MFFRRLGVRFRSHARRPVLLIAVPLLLLVCLAPAWSPAALPRVSMNVEPVVVWSTADAHGGSVARLGLRVAIQIGRFHLDVGWPHVTRPDAQAPQAAADPQGAIHEPPASAGV